jgi:hypothetical protein
LPLFIKGLLKEGLGLLLFAFGFGLGFSLWFLLWAVWCGKLLGGKRISKGKRMAKEGLMESLH